MGEEFGSRPDRREKRLEPDTEPKILLATPDRRRRTLSLLRSDDKTDRYALHRYSGGAVAWRADTFSAPRDPTQPEKWIAYHGELTLGELIARLPGHARLLREWTRDEIECGVDVEGAEDFSARDRRGRSLERLRAELDAATNPPSRDAAA